MKKFFVVILFATFIGSLCGIFLFLDSNSKVDAMINSKSKLFFFQLGVFENYDNALEFQKKYDNSIIEKDDNYYRVYFAILKNKKNIEKLSDYLKTNNINFYIRNKQINSASFLSKNTEYEKIISKTKDEEVFIKTIKKINSLYQKEVLDNEN